MSPLRALTGGGGVVGGPGGGAGADVQRHTLALLFLVYEPQLLARGRELGGTEGKITHRKGLERFTGTITGTTSNTKSVILPIDYKIVNRVGQDS